MIRRSEHLDCRALRVDEERNQGQRVFASRMVIGSDSGDLCLQLVVRGGRGVANVDGELQVGIDHVNGARDAGQRIEVSVGRVDSDGAAPSVESMIFTARRRNFGLVLVAEVMLKRITREHANGVTVPSGSDAWPALAVATIFAQPSPASVTSKPAGAGSSAAFAFTTRVAWLGTALVAASPW